MHEEAERLLAEARKRPKGNFYADTAVAKLESAVEKFSALGLREAEARTLGLLAVAARRSGNTARAHGAGEACIALARSRNDPMRLAHCLSNHSSTVKYEGQPARAAELLEEALGIWQGQQDPGSMAVALVNLAAVRILTGDYPAAETALRRAIPLSEEEGDDETLAVALHNLAVSAQDRGDYGEALPALERARELYRKTGSPFEAQAAANLASIYGSLGDAERALRLSREVADSPAPKATRALAHGDMAAALADLGDLPGAADAYRQAAALYGEAGDPARQTENEAWLAWVLAQQGAVEEADARLVRAIATHEAMGYRAGLTRDWCFLGRTRLLAGELDRAREPLEQALSIARTDGMLDAEFDAWSALARLSQARADLPEALERAEKAIAAAESVRARAAVDEARAGYLGRRREAYDLAVDVLMALDQREPGRGHLERALQMAERAKARSLLEELTGGRARIGRSADPALSARWRAAAERISRVQRQLLGERMATKSDAAAVARLEGQLQEASAEEEAARRSVRLAAPDFARLIEPELASATDLRARMAADEALVEYHVGEERSWMFLLDADGLAAWPLAPARELLTQVQALRDEVATPRVLGAPRFARIAHDLYRSLLGPAAARLAGKRRVILVPDGPLWELPFEALVTGTEGRHYADLPYLVRRFALTYEPSASVLLSLERRTRGRPPVRPAPTLVAFANPSVLAPAAAQAPLARLERAVFADGGPWRLARLPDAEREALAVARLFGPQGARTFVGREALESRVKSDPAVSQARYLLFSAHALLSELLPAQSGLVLSVGGDDGAEDGLLQVYEIYNLELTADLAVLSACESALGRRVRGEGLLGLARAFFYAGARAIVASLWKVADRSTADLVIELFRGLSGTGPDRDPAAALRRAKLATLRQPGYAHPYYWAPFVLVGETGPRAAAGH